MKYIMALDAGTTSSRTILFDGQGRICARAQKEFTQYYPRPGWVEHDAEEIWSSQLWTAREAMRQAGAQAEDVAAIGIANQRETAVIWERKTGRPVHPAIVWQCRRTAGICEQLRLEGREGFFRERTGLPIDAYFSATKIGWILDHIPEGRQRARRGELAFGTVDTWLIWKLTGGRSFATDPSNAARTMLFNIHTLDWDEDILRELDIPRCMLPEVRPSAGDFGTAEEELFGGTVPIRGSAGDQQAALFGHRCFSPGMMKNTYGTGAFLLMNTGEAPVRSAHGLITTVAWSDGQHVSYALEGSVFVAGALIQWLRDELGIIPDAASSEALAGQVEDTHGCCIVPAFAGLGAPYWDPFARGTIVGLTRGVNRCHIARAALESIACQVDDLLQAMQADAGQKAEFLAADGGAAANRLLLQLQADISCIRVVRPGCLETTAMGAAFLAGLSSGFWDSPDRLPADREAEQSFLPQISEEERQRGKRRWQDAVARSRNWAIER